MEKGWECDEDGWEENGGEYRWEAGWLYNFRDYGNKMTTVVVVVCLLVCLFVCLFVSLFVHFCINVSFLTRARQIQW